MAAVKNTSGAKSKTTKTTTSRKKEEKSLPFGLKKVPFFVIMTFVIILLGLSVFLAVKTSEGQSENIQGFINVETRFSLADANDNKKMSLIYGSREFEQQEITDTNYKIGVPVVLNVMMNPTLLSKAKKVKKSEKNTDRDITVEITITKSKAISVTQSGGMSNVIPLPSSIDGSVTYQFTIKNDSEIHPSLTFKFTPSQIGEASIAVKYYGTSPEDKIVADSCDVYQNLYFIE